MGTLDDYPEQDSGKPVSSATDPEKNDAAEKQAASDGETTNLSPKSANNFAQLVYLASGAWWSTRADDVRRAWAAYQVAMAHVQDMGGRARPVVSVPDAATHIDSYLGALFLQNLSFEFGRPLNMGGSGKADAESAEAIANKWISSDAVWQEVQRAGLLALCFPGGAGLKVAPRRKPWDRGEPVSNPYRMLDAHGLYAVAPWDLIIDYAARNPHDQRYIGTRSYLTKAELCARYKIDPKRVTPFLDAPADISNGVMTGEGTTGCTNAYGGPSFSGLLGLGGTGIGAGAIDGASAGVSIPDDMMWCDVVELYDLVHDQLIVWSPNVKAPEDEGEQSDAGSDMFIGGLLQSPCKIPLRSCDDEPVVPVSQFGFLSDPTSPMAHNSIMSRVVWQAFEKSFLRTSMLEGTRRDARLWAVTKGVLQGANEDNIKKLQAPSDGDVLELELPKGASIRDALAMVDQGSLSTNHERYQAMLDSDLERGTPAGQFSRGEAAGARTTATEVELLASYTTTQFGMLATIRNRVLTSCAAAWIRATHLLLSGSSKGREGIVIDVNAQRGGAPKPKTITATSINADFTIVVAEGNATPISRAVQRAQSMQLIPMLQQLGVPPAELARYLTDLFDEIPDYVVQAIKSPEPGALAGALAGTGGRIPGNGGADAASQVAQAAAAVPTRGAL